MTSIDSEPSIDSEAMSQQRPIKSRRGQRLRLHHKSTTTPQNCDLDGAIRKETQPKKQVYEILCVPTRSENMQIDLKGKK